MIYSIDYLNSISPSIVQNICTTLNCSPEDIRNIIPLKVGLTNQSFCFSLGETKYVYRHPGNGTDEFINRKSEAFSEQLAVMLGLDDSMVAIDSEDGWKISLFIDHFQYIDPYSEDDKRLAMDAIKKLHNCGQLSKWNFDYMEQSDLLVQLPKFREHVVFLPYIDIHERIRKLSNNLSSEKHKVVICHNDAWHWNMLKDSRGKVNLIDWEYSGNYYPAADVAYFTSSLSYTDNDFLHLAEIYEGHPLSDYEKRYYFSVLSIVLWYWFIWALYKEYLGTYIEDKQLWFDKSIHALQIAEEMYESL